MEELITLNQLKAYDDEKTNIWHNNITTNNLTADNAVINNVTITGTIADLNVTNTTIANAKVDTGVANSFNVADLVAGNAEIDGVNANNLNVVELVANNGTIESLVTTNIASDNLTANNGNIENFVADNMSVNNLKVDSFITSKNSIFVEDLTVNNSATVYGDVFTHKGFDVASTKIIMEDEYNSLGAEARNDAFYVTGPNGNMYFKGIRWAPSYAPPATYIAYVDLPGMAYSMQTLTTSTLTFTSDAVTNSFVRRGKYNGIYIKSMFGEAWDKSAPVGTQANTGSIITNANELYIIDANSMYYNCQNLTDTFISNPSLITNAPGGYDPLKYCINMAFMFGNCRKFNQPVNIPNSVTNMTYMFQSCSNFNQPVNIPDSVTMVEFMFVNCSNFNQPVNIPDSVTHMASMFDNCRNFNQPVNIGNGVTKLVSVFGNCNNFNQPVNIPDSVTSLVGTFINCRNFNQPVNIGNGVTNMMYTFYNCTTLASSTVPIHISSSIALGNTSNYIYNCLVNGYTGITFDPSRILNDL